MNYLNFVKFGIAILLLSSLSSCKWEKQKKGIPELAKNGESLIRVNKFLVNKDEILIRNFVRRQQWDMKTTKSGLWYQIYQKGKGKKAEPGKIAVYNYSISLLDGTVCYHSKIGYPAHFRIGQGGVESGLEEGILFLREGDKARLIMPPFMAHGLLGDENKIPPLSVIVYDIEIVKIVDE